MYPKKRDIEKFSGTGRSEFDSLKALISTPLADGISSLRINSRWFDIFYEDRGAAVTIVAFHAAISKENKTFPVFSGYEITKDLEANYLGISDPLSGNEEALPVAWHLGSERVESSTIIPAIVDHAIASRSGSRLVFFGSSAGGFAALSYSSKFPGSTAFVLNPRIDLLSPPLSFGRYAKAAYPGMPHSLVEKQYDLNMSNLYSKRQSNFVFYLQNKNDPIYFDFHFSQFINKINNRNNILFRLGSWGQGHVVPPRDIIFGTLRHFCKPDYDPFAPINTKWVKSEFIDKYA